MASFSQIPELSVAEVLSKAMGGLVGSLGGKAMDTATKLQDKMIELCQKASNGDTSVMSQIEAIEKTVDALEKTIDALDKALGTIEKVAATLEIPLTVLDIALKIAKMIPMPVPPPILVLISMLSELIAQIKQIVSAMKTVAGVLRDILNIIRELLKNIRRMIDALKAAIALMLAGSNDALEDKGVVNDDGTNILSDVGAAMANDGTSLISIGGAKITQEISSSGDWISTVYIQSADRPATPTSREFQPEGWTLAEPTVSGLSDNLATSAADAMAQLEEESSSATEELPWWYSKATISGETDKVNGKWSRPERYLGPGSEGDDLSGLGDGSSTKGVLGDGSGLGKTKIEGTISPDDFLKGEYGKNGGAVLALDGPDDAYNFLVDLIGVINASGISLGDQDKFRKLFGEQDMNDKKKHYYTTPNGDILELEVVVDPKSPSIAPLYYVTATDIKSKGIVYTGTKTFATDEEVLIEEATVRLDRIFL